VTGPIYTDNDFHRLHVSDGLITITTPGMPSAAVDQPTGDTAVEVARAVLDEAGDTGHVVVPEYQVISPEELAAEKRAYAEASALSMRDRAVAAIQPRWDLQPEAQAEAVEAIAALPLLAADTTGPTVTHADLPEAVTPCGHGSQDVTTTTRVSEVTCLGCLRALAQAADGDRLPEGDLVEPGDEVPALAELADRVTALEERLPPPTKLVAFASEPPGPARYRDRHGDIWEDKGDGRVGLAVVGSRDVELVSAFPFAQAEASWGPLVRVGAATGGAE
jgi:hypothetical protein